jgi:hypothetical protein
VTRWGRFGLALPAAAAALLAGAGSAPAAGDAIFTGAVKGDPAAKLSFALVKSRGLERVVRMEFENVPEQCDGLAPGRVWFDKSIFGTATVRKDGSWSAGHGSADLEGQLSKNRKSARGTFEFEGNVYPQGSPVPVHCSTGELAWTASRR